MKNKAETYASLDVQVRAFVYDQCINLARVPMLADVAKGLNLTLDQVKASFKRLGEGHMLVLQSDGEILMANPFSAVPTPFRVQGEQKAWFGNCIWDAFGVLAMVNQDGEIATACGDCGDALTLQIRDGKLIPNRGLIHFAIPARHWWDDIVYN